MMKKIIIFILLILGTASTKAQNPISYPKDTTVSPPELNFEVLWHTFEDNYTFISLFSSSYRQYEP